MNARTLARCACALVLWTHGVEGQGAPQYRGFQLGGDVASVAALAGVQPSEAKVIHRRPAVLQDLQWRPSHWLGGSTTAQTDPVQQIVFSFYDDQLFRVVVDYDCQRTQGMTDGDMIDAISEAYGSPVKAPPKNARGTASNKETETDTPVARWGDTEYAVVLYRTAYASAFKLIVTSPQLDARARTADAQSRRLDARAPPRRQVARQKKETEDSRASREKVRVANKAAFRP